MRAYYGTLACVILIAANSAAEEPSVVVRPVSAEPEKVGFFQRLIGAKSSQRSQEAPITTRAETNTVENSGPLFHRPTRFRAEVVSEQTNDVPEQTNDIPSSVPPWKTKKKAEAEEMASRHM